MKRIYYNIVANAEEDVEILQEKSIPYSEANEAIAKAEAYNGEYTIEDDGQPEPEIPTEDDVWADMAAALQEGVDSV